MKYIMVRFQGDIVVIRYEGPKGGPGMRDAKPYSAIAGMGLDKDVALITDGSPPELQEVQP